MFSLVDARRLTLATSFTYLSSYQCAPKRTNGVSPAVCGCVWIDGCQCQKPFVLLYARRTIDDLMTNEISRRWYHNRLIHHDDDFCHRVSCQACRTFHLSLSLSSVDKRMWISLSDFSSISSMFFNPFRNLQPGHGYGAMAPGPFRAVYQCYSAAFLTDRERHNVENGGKILLPQAALEQLVEQVACQFQTTVRRTSLFLSLSRAASCYSNWKTRKTTVSHTAAF